MNWAKVLRKFLWPQKTDDRRKSTLTTGCAEHSLRPDPLWVVSVCFLRCGVWRVAVPSMRTTGTTSVPRCVTTPPLIHREGICKITTQWRRNLYRPSRIFQSRLVWGPTRTFRGKAQIWKPIFSGLAWPGVFRYNVWWFSSVIISLIIKH